MASDADGRLPGDLVAIAALTVATVAVATLPGLRESPLRVVVGLAFLLVAPGYATVAALFPDPPGADPGLDRLERVVLAAGVTLALIPLLGLAVALSPVPFGTTAVLATVVGATLLGLAVAVWRRPQYPGPAAATWTDAGGTARLREVSGPGAALSVLLAAGVFESLQVLG